MAQPKVQFGFTRPVTDIHQFLDWVRVAEQADPDLYGVGDGQELWDELYVTLALLAANTRRAKIGPTVSNPLTRYPSVTASAVSTLQQYTKGRVFLGLASGLSALRNAGLKTATIAELEQYVRAVQGLTAGKTISFKGHPIRLSWKAPKVPVWVGARGPRGLALAGRVADGVIVGGGVTKPEQIRDVLAKIDVGCKQVGRDINELEIWWLTRVVLAPTEEQGIDLMRDYLATHAAHHYRDASMLAQAPKDVQEKIHVMEQGYKWDEHLAGNAGPDGLTNNARLLESTGIKSWLADRFVITGPPEHCKKGLESLIEVGAHNHMIPQVLPGQLQTTKELGEEFFPLFRN